MPRYFIEVAYKGTNYSGFQIQKNANSIQAEITKALKIFFKRDFELTGSSRTDAGVHALQNFFHFEVDESIINEQKLDSRETEQVLSFGKGLVEALNSTVYNLNAILPSDIVIKKIFLVKDNAHCRFDAINREYKYFIYQNKNPFLQERAFYFPYKLDIDKLNEAAKEILKYEDFTSFSKQNTQVNNFICKIKKSEWILEDDTIVYNVIANRFLRGMVKGLVGTMLRVATNKISIDEFKKIIKDKDLSKVDFSPSSNGLFLKKITFSADHFIV